MKLSLTIQTPEVETPVFVALLTGSLEEKLAKAARWGADGVELMSTHPEKLDVRQISAMLASHGLQAAAVASGGMTIALGLTLLNADPHKARVARDKLTQLIDLAAAIKAPVVTIGGFCGRLANVLGQDGRQVLIETLQNAADYAMPRGVRLALEALNHYEADLVVNAQQGLEFVAEVDHPALGLLLDTYHVNIEEASWTAPFQLVSEAGKLFHVHLGDNNRLPPGQGLIDFASIVAMLRQLHYPGFLSAELLAKPDPDRAARRTLEYMRKLLA
jgi:sugar phosphate isomerase/epimerase